MEVLNKLIETLLYFIPALLVLGGVYLTLKKYLDNDYKLRLLEAKRNSIKEVLPLRLQAYERMCLFLERISPGNLIMRTNKAGMTARELHLEMLVSIRTEFEHNFSQQMYMSSKVWDTVKNAKEDTVKLINLAAGNVSENAAASQLTKAVFDIMMKTEKIPTQRALELVKNEARQLF